MLGKLSDQVRECLARAEECARKAESALSEETRDDYRRLQRSWLVLANSFALGERLVDFSAKNDRRLQQLFKNEK
jgi:hypothetical protein